MTSKLWILCVLLLLAVSVRAQQSVISYQGAIANPAGMPADSGTYSITVSFYTDESGTQPLWQDTFGTFVKNGIFNIALGSARPLPPPSVLDRPIWVGVRVGSMAESRPLTRLTAVPMAMNVADSSITSAKMATDYVSSISVNGQKVTGQGSNLNIVGGDGMNLAYDNASNSLVLNTSGSATNIDGKGAKAETSDTTEYWSETGNHSVPPPHYYLGTSDSEAFEIHVNNNGDTNAGNGRVMRYEPMPTSPNIIGGFRTNDVSAGVYGATIAGGGSEADSNIVLGNFGTISGGNGNTAYDGATIGGGDMNSASEGATVAGGSGNSAFQGGTVSGGGPNFADNWATVGGGVYNQAEGNYTTVGGGSGNTAEASVSLPMTYPGQYSTISGGFSNTIYGTAGAIPGGAGMSIGSYSFGFNGDSSFLAFGSGITDLTAVTGIAYFGDVNLMIGNVDSVARQLRFYGPNTDHTYGSGAKFTSFQAPLMDSDVFYVLPKAQGDTNTVLTEDGHGNLSWASQLGALDWSITGNFGTHAPTNFIGTLDSQAFEIHIHNNTLDTSGGNQRVMQYSEGWTSPNILGGSSFNTIAPSLSGAAILSGGSNAEPNSVSDTLSVVAGGEWNTIDVGGSHSIIGGGEGNYINAEHAAIGGGGFNEATGRYSFVGGGGGYIPTSGGDAMSMSTPSFVTPILLPYNAAGAQYTVIGGGGGNSAVNTLSSILGGEYNFSAGYASTIGGGAYNDARGSFSTIAGGQYNTVYDSNSTIGGGQGNSIYVSNATVAGGCSNRIDAGSPYASILGGENNLVQDTGAVITGGISDSILFTISTERSGKDCFIGAGTLNKIEGNGIDSEGDNYSYNSAIVAGQNNLVRQENSMIGAGSFNTVTEGSEFIGAGDQNSDSASESGIVAGYQNSILWGAYKSMIGAGESNVIDTGSSFSAIAAGSNNWIFNPIDAKHHPEFDVDYDFIGAGEQDSILSSFSTIVSGLQNKIGFASTNSFIGAGSSDTIMAGFSVINGGTTNAIDSSGQFGSIGGGSNNRINTGTNATIPGGDHLTAQSYAQTVLGYFNVPAGSTTDSRNACTGTHGDDPLVIVGNGMLDTLNIAHDSDAALISNNGHISAFQNVLDGGAKGLLATDATHVGTIYENNTTIAWGNVQGLSTGFTVLDDIGVFPITRSGATYLISLNVKDQDGVTIHTFTPNDCAITASITQGETGTPGMISVQPIFNSAGQFRITTFNSSGLPDSLLGFMFQVVAR